jgi:hypothetical protein
VPTGEEVQFVPLGVPVAQQDQFSHGGKASEVGPSAPRPPVT